MSELKFTQWALEQIKTRSAPAEPAQQSLQTLVDALGAIRGKEGVQLFGLSADRIEPAGRGQVEAGLIAALVGWKQHFEAAKDSVALLALTGVGTAHAIAELASSGRAALRCDPLGTRDHLPTAWLTRLARLDEAKAGRRALKISAIEYAGSEDAKVEFGAPDQAALYEFALRFEAEQEVAFPRELAAFFSTANGVLIGDDPVLRAVSDWEWDFDDRGLTIGCGGYVQGSLILEGERLDGGVLDVDDDGVERARYASFAAFVDALLGA